jgi:hypothetical protein
MIFKSDPENEKVFLQIKNISELSKKGIRQAYYDIGKDLRQTTQELILDNDKSGKVYVRRLSGRLVRHQASAPGQAPANLTGNLRRSIGFDVRGGEQLEFGSRAGLPQGATAPQAIAEYSKGLEVGTSKVAARPYLKPSIEQNNRNAFTRFEQRLKEELCK